MPLSDTLNKLIESCRANNHRACVVLSGELEWGRQIISAWSLDNTDSLWIGDQATQLCARYTSSKQLAGELGNECMHLVWNAHDGFAPNTLGQASGLVQGGGLFIILIPTLQRFLSRPDSTYASMCSSEQQVEQCGTHFLQRCFRYLSDSPSTLVIEQHSINTVPSLEKKANKQSSKERELELQLTDDQQEALQAIETVATGHRHRPLVLTANRGRGKSTILGIAASKLINKRADKILLTAPKPGSTAQSLKHFRSRLENDSRLSLFEFMAPDALVHSLPEAHLLIIDEAASIPVPMLETMLRHYPRVVFSSTVHGYEGTGQGFAVRLHGLLDQIRPEWRKLHMEQAVRWAANDPLEQAVFNALCLNQPALPEPLLNLSFDELYFGTIEQNELATNEYLLSQVMALLTQAHYQTSPADLRMLLDHPDVRLLVCLQDTSLIGLILLLKEDPRGLDIAPKDIAYNLRRGKGMLAPQALSAFHTDEEILALSSQRIVRIAVRPEARKQGIGHMLVQHAFELISGEGIDYLSVSYGLRADLHRFWQGSNFISHRLGYRKDKSSGVHSVLACRPSSAKAGGVLSHFTARFHEHLRFGLSRYYQKVDAHDLASLLSELPKPANWNERRVRGFAESQLAEFDVAHELFEFVMLALHSQCFASLPRKSQDLLINRVVQGHAWEDCCRRLTINGHKAGLQLLRATISELIEKVSAN